jgi:hypothetical protein
MPSAQVPHFPFHNELDEPVIGLESEFRVFVDEVEITPEEVWRTPAGFIDEPLLKRTNKASQLPTGGAVYFDGGVIEVVTPVIEIAPQCTARVVRSLWEQVGFVRDQLDRWEVKSGRQVRLQAFSCHVNISFELDRSERGSKRTIQKLAVLLSHLLPVPVIVVGANRLSTGIGVRPRRDRIEITLDFTPDPGLMAATVALIVGIAREVISWASYLISDLEAAGIPLLAELVPGKHPSRKGWIAKGQHFPRDPFAADLDEPHWKTREGRMLSLRELALETALHFRDPIRKLSDPFSYRLLFSVLRGETAALLDLDHRPAAYDDVGRSTRWGSVLPELENFAALMNDGMDDAIGDGDASVAEPQRRSADVEQRLAPPWRGEPSDRRHDGETPGEPAERRRKERRLSPPPSPSRSLTRSNYEKVFLNLGRRRPLRIEGELLTPIAVRGWYHSVFRAPNGEERMLSIDQLLANMGGWE